MKSNPCYLRFCWMTSASPISFESDRPNALASDLETFRLGFRKPLSTRPMYVGCKPAFSASDSCESFIASLCRLSTTAKASDISQRRIEGVCKGKRHANTDNSLDLTQAPPCDETRGMQRSLDILHNRHTTRLTCAQRRQRLAAGTDEPQTTCE